MQPGGRVRESAFVFMFEFVEREKKKFREEKV